MIPIRLKGISQDADFRCTEMNIFKKSMKKKEFENDLKPGEAYLYISKRGNQLLWILNYSTIKNQKYSHDVVESLRLRLSGGAWNPMMLANYAEDVGIQLVGIKKFEEMYTERRAR